MNATMPYRLAQGVSVRSERFGALIYRYDNRRLYFIHSRNVADFISGLDGSQPLEDAVADHLADHSLPPSTGDSLLRTMGQLEKMGIVNSVPLA